MVQLEIAERLAAEPGDAGLRVAERARPARLRVEILRRVDPAVFVPAPARRSAVVRLERRGPAATPAVRDLVRGGVRPSPQDARRLARAGEPGTRPRPRPRRARGPPRCPRTPAPNRSRPRTSSASPRSSRGLTPTETPAMTLRAPAKLNLCLYLGPRRDDGKHELASLVVPLSLADRITVADADADEVVCPERRGIEPRGPRARRAARARLAAAARADRDRKADPGRGRPRRGQRRRRGGPAPRRAARSTASSRSPLSWAPTSPRRSIRASRCSRGAGEQVEELPRPGEFGLVLIPGEDGLSTADVLRRGRPARSRPLPRGARRARGADRRSGRVGPIAARLPGASRQRPRARGALAASGDPRGARRAAGRRRGRLACHGLGSHRLRAVRRPGRRRPGRDDVAPALGRRDRHGAPETFI